LKISRVLLSDQIRINTYKTTVNSIRLESTDRLSVLFGFGLVFLSFGRSFGFVFSGSLVFTAILVLITFLFSAIGFGLV